MAQTATRLKKDRRKTRKFDAKEWRFKRLSAFQRAVKFGAAARSVRVLHDVTQEEVGAAYGVSGASVCYWETGHYFGWTHEELDEYMTVCRRLAG